MKKTLIAAGSSLGLLALSASKVFGATFEFTGEAPFTNLGSLLGNLLVLLFAFSAMLSFVFIVIGGIQWITAGGDKIAAQSARDRITAAVVGLIIVVSAFAITLIITTLLGVNLFEGTITFPEADNPIFGPSGGASP